MNEIELLRNQLATERRHVQEIASACAAAHLSAPGTGEVPLEPLRRACGDYLGCVLDWFDRRDERLGELIERLPPADGGRRTALAALRARGHGREALERLKERGPARETWQAVAQFINGPWDARRRAIEELLSSNARVADWRAFSGVDADSVCHERALYAGVRAALPSGTALGPA